MKLALTVIVERVALTLVTLITGAAVVNVGKAEENKIRLIKCQVLTTQVEMKISTYKLGDTWVIQEAHWEQALAVVMASLLVVNSAVH